MSTLSEWSDIGQARLTINDEVNMLFVEFIKNNRILLDKRRAPSIKKKRNVVLVQLQIEYERKFGKSILIPQIEKNIIKIKARLKKKCDANKTGNHLIKLTCWEKQLLELLNYKWNPVLNKEGSLDGRTYLSESTDSDSKDMHPTLENTSTEFASARVFTNDYRSLKEKQDSIHILSKYETYETQNLSLSDLQRLVTLKRNLVLDKKLKLADKRLNTEEMVERLVMKKIDLDEFKIGYSKKTRT